MLTEIRKGVLDYIPPELIDTEWCLLRSVEKNAIEFQDLKNSIKEKGILETILVRRIKTASGEVALSLIDGLHRLTGAKEVGLKTVPCNILENVDDDEALALQIQANLFQVQTRKADFAKAAKILINRYKDTMSIASLAKMLNCRVSYLRDLLKLTNLPEEIQQMVNEGVITMNHALLLTQLPGPELQDWVETAQKRPKDFKVLAGDRIKQLRSAKLKTKDDKPWEPTPVFRKKHIIEAEINDPKVVKQLVDPKTTPQDAFILGLKYVLSIDPITIAERKNHHENLLREDEERRKAGVKQKAEEQMKILKAKMEALQEKIDENQE